MENSTIQNALFLEAFQMSRFFFFFYCIAAIFNTKDVSRPLEDAGANQVSPEATWRPPLSTCLQLGEPSIPACHEIRQGMSHSEKEAGLSIEPLLNRVDFNRLFLSCSVLPFLQLVNSSNKSTAQSWFFFFNFPQSAGQHEPGASREDV